MKISFQWLEDFVDLSQFKNKIEDLSALLTRAGLEVEGIEDPAKDFNHVVVGKIIVKGQHPNSDRLSLCQVEVGDGVIRSIICGATNHKSGDNVVVALPGAVLPGNFVIQKAKVRGTESEGMLCSEKELGFKETSEGILILPTDAPIGKAFAQYMKLDDSIIEIKVTPNRADCLSHLGVAREIAGLTEKSIKNIPLKKVSTENKLIAVENTTACPIYSGQVIENVSVKPSPEWLQQRLQKVGLRSINNIVDVTNYVMMELGQPMHAFDFAKIHDGKIIVRDAKPGEKIKLLDDSTIELKGSELLITDSKGPLCVAGVMGGKESGVSDSTKKIFLEAALFSAASVRKTSRMHGIQSDSAYRFSRGVDPATVGLALQRATQLICEVSGGNAVGNPQLLSNWKFSPKEIELRLPLLQQRSGIEFTTAEVEKFLKQVHCEVTANKKAESFKVFAPSFRQDLEMEMDLVEECTRLKGYEHIPETVAPTENWPIAHSDLFLAEKKCSAVLQGEGFFEAFNLIFTSDQLQKQHSKISADKFVYLKNPLNSEMNILRSSLFFGLQQNLLSNFRKQNEQGQLFEIGTVFEKQTASDKQSGYKEKQNLGLISWGLSQDLWENKNTPQVFKLKKAVENILQAFQISRFSWEKLDFSADLSKVLHPQQSAMLKVEGQVIGFLGSMHPQILDKEKIRVPVAFAEMDIQVLKTAMARKRKFAVISAFPKVQRDFAFLMPVEMPVSDVSRLIEQSGKDVIQKVSVVDLFTGESIGKEFKSVAFRVIYQSASKTLADQEITELQGKIIAQVEQKLKIKLR